MAQGLNALLEDEFAAKVLNAEKPVLVEFGASWCGPCRMLEPVLNELASQYGGKVHFYTVNVDMTPELVMDYDIMGVPTIILFREGKPHHRLTGYRPKHVLENTFFDEFVKN